MCYCPTPTLHLNLALTGDGAFLLSLKKTHSVWFIGILNYGDTENVLINHLLLVIPMSYPCHYTNLCPHKPHKHAHTHTLVLWFTGTLHRRNGFYTVTTVCAIALHPALHTFNVHSHCYFVEILIKIVCPAMSNVLVYHHMKADKWMGS